jgi:hypothetical protein
MYYESKNANARIPVVGVPATPQSEWDTKDPDDIDSGEPTDGWSVESDPTADRIAAIRARGMELLTAALGVGLTDEEKDERKALGKELLTLLTSQVRRAVDDLNKGGGHTSPGVIEAGSLAAARLSYMDNINVDDIYLSVPFGQRVGVLGLALRAAYLSAAGVKCDDDIEN